MTDRYNALVVTLEKDTRDDDAEFLINAIKMLKGVLSVKGNISDFEQHTAEERVRAELGQKLLDVIYPDRYKS